MGDTYSFTVLPQEQKMKTLPSKMDVMRLLQEEKGFIANEFGVVSLGLFGSFAKGEQEIGSDIDLLVEFKAPRFDWMAGLQIYLEEKLGRRIEIVRKGKHISHRFQKVIEKDILYV